MSNLQLIEALCKLVEYLSEIVRSLAAALEQERALSDTETELLSNAERQYSAILGANETPDFLK